jgi:hypothetical protein
MADRPRATDPPFGTGAPGCDLCGDADGALFLRARCHLTAPLLARLDGEWLILSCYLPTCGREVVRLKVATGVAT